MIGRNILFQSQTRGLLVLCGILKKGCLKVGHMKKTLVLLAFAFTQPLFAETYPMPAGEMGSVPGGYMAPSPDAPPPPDFSRTASAFSVPKFTVPVLAANPVYQPQMRERRVCERTPPSAGTNAVGALIGGVAGGILGNQIGRGKGRGVATAAGVVGGALAGNAVANSAQETPNCQTVYEQQQVLVGYDVSYEFYGQRGLVRMSQRPGPSIVVEVKPAGL